jgi:hypothetical protein
VFGPTVPVAPVAWLISAPVVRDLQRGRQEEDEPEAAKRSVKEPRTEIAVRFFFSIRSLGPLLPLRNPVELFGSAADLAFVALTIRSPQESSRDRRERQEEAEEEDDEEVGPMPPPPRPAMGKEANPAADDDMVGPMPPRAVDEDKDEEIGPMPPPPPVPTSSADKGKSKVPDDDDEDDIGPPPPPGFEVRFP